MENFSYEFITSKQPAELQSLLLDINQWWSGVYGETIIGKSEKINDEYTYEAGEGVHFSKQKLVELIPNQRIVWLVTESKLTFLRDPEEWNETKICFDISLEGKKTKVRFTHQGLNPEKECYDACSNGWTAYLDNLKKRLA